MSTRDAYVAKMKAALNEWNAELSKLEARAASAEADAKLRFQKQIEALREQREEARAKLREFESASDAAWRDMQHGAEAAWSSLNQAWSDAMKRFR
ncbi:MAG: sll1863 family stress response protein [Planctomycetota bacterium]|jgi:predicted  nucleic acid-binding Zn-ribbon protein